jgi:type I restriction enzyme S subunit
MTKDEYKAKLSWLETIPHTWDVKPLWSVTRERSTKVSEGELLSVYLDRGVIRATDGSLGTHAPSETMDNYQEVRPGDFILNNQQAWRGSVGVSFESGIISPAYLIFELSDSLDWKYSNYLLRARPMVDQYMLASQGVGSIQRQVHAPSFKNVLMVIPPLSSQKKIATFLDERTKVIDILVEKKEKLIELLREKRQSLITHVVTKGLNPKAKMKPSGVDWLGAIPKEWEVSKLWDIYTYKKERAIREEELLSVYRDHGVIPKSSRDDNRNKESEDLSSYLLVRPDDLVINKMKAWQGSVSVSAYRGIVSPAYFTYRLTKVGSEKLYLRYVHHLLRSKMYIETYKRISKGIRPGQWDLDPYQFKVLPVVLPPLETQKEIAEFLDDHTVKIDSTCVLLDKQITALKEYRSSLIYSAVTGEIKI